MKIIAMITGATGGIGGEFTKIMLQEPVEEIWVIGRNAEKLDSLREHLGERIVPVCADLTERQGLKTVCDRLCKERPVVAWLINNAGMARMGASADFEEEEIRKTVELNCVAPTLLINACIPFMERGSRILNISSASAFQPTPYLNLYASTKAFVRSYTRALNAELNPKGITATAVCPGWVDTPMLAREINGQKVHFPGMVSAQKVANKAIRDAKRGKDMSVCSLYVKCQHVNVKLMPQRLTMKIWLMGIRKYIGVKRDTL